MTDGSVRLPTRGEPRYSGASLQKFLPVKPAGGEGVFLRLIETRQTHDRSQGPHERTLILSRIKNRRDADLSIIARACEVHTRLANGSGGN
jgi:hypothetical protein